MRIQDPVVKEHQEMVTELVKPGEVIAAEMNYSKATQWAHAVQVCVIAEGVLSNAKKRAVYNQNVPIKMEEVHLPSGFELEQAARNMDGRQANLLHAATGIATEALELLVSVANSTLGGREEDLFNLVEEMGDIDFYMEQFRQGILVNREEILRGNITKLRKRYAEGYSDTQAQNRADKQQDDPPAPPPSRQSEGRTTTDISDPGLHQTRPDGQNEKYIVLPEDQRANAPNPVRRAYIHTECGALTTIGEDIARTYAANPKFYASTYCTNCKDHFPVGQFRWDEDGVVVGE